MEHILQPAILSPPPPQSIGANTFSRLKEARGLLNAAFSIEENFDLLVGNFIELETSALALATTAMVRHVSEYRELFEFKAELNRRAVNLLTAARLFVDQLPQRYRDCGQDPEQVKQLLSAQYDSHFEYRFMEALRNHVQHNGLAVHNLGINSKWLPSGERLWDEHHLVAEALKSFLSEDGSFKATVLAECPDRIDILASARRYVESLGEVQDDIRRNIAIAVGAAREITKDAIDGYVAFSGASPIGLEAQAISDKSRLERVPVFLDWDDVRMKLANRNSSMRNLSIRTVVSAKRRDGV